MWLKYMKYSKYVIWGQVYADPLQPEVFFIAYVYAESHSTLIYCVKLLSFI